MLQIFVFTIALASIVFLSLQPNKDGRQDKIIANVSSEVLYLKDVSAMLEMQLTTSTLIETGVCSFFLSDERLISGGSPEQLVPNIFIKYNLYKNVISSYIVFENTTNIPLPSETNPLPEECPFTSEYIYRTIFTIGKCTTEMTGVNFTQTKFSEILFRYGTLYQILKSEQEKFNFQNNLDHIFTYDYAEDSDQFINNFEFNPLCRPNQVFGLTQRYSFLNSLDPENIYLATNAFQFSVYLKNSSTGFSIDRPFKILLGNTLEIKQG